MYRSLFAVARLINHFRLVPRLLMVGYGWLLWQVSLWFMALPEPTAAQAAFVSTVAGVSTGFFGFYVNTGGRK